jgi:hypothetical protein
MNEIEHVSLSCLAVWEPTDWIRLMRQATRMGILATLEPRCKDTSYLLRCQPATRNFRDKYCKFVANQTS